MSPMNGTRRHLPREPVLGVGEGREGGSQGGSEGGGRNAYSAVKVFRFLERPSCDLHAMLFLPKMND